MLPQERVEQYQNLFKETLDRMGNELRLYQANRSFEKGDIFRHAEVLADLSLRVQAVRCKNPAACYALLTACHDVFTKLYRAIMELLKQLAVLETHKAIFEEQYHGFLAELGEEDPKVPMSLKYFYDWVNDILGSLNNHAKYLELNLNGVRSKFMKGLPFLDDFKEDYKFSETIEMKICLGLIKMDRLSKNPMNLTQ
ncbi:hypothetical protein KR026_009336 [Drosophila bipectinata]|nr:hypothetical protein KR026_009336 [Drosophila bipectinata]